MNINTFAKNELGEDLLDLSRLALAAMDSLMDGDSVTFLTNTLALQRSNQKLIKDIEDIAKAENIAKDRRQMSTGAEPPKVKRKKKNDED